MVAIPDPSVPIANPRKLYRERYPVCRGGHFMPAGELLVEEMMLQSASRGQSSQEDHRVGFRVLMEVCDEAHR